MTKRIKVALLGFGNVGRPLVELMVAEEARIQAQGVEFVITGAADTKGAALCKEGMAAQMLLYARKHAGSVSGVEHCGHKGMSGAEMIEASGAQMLLECLPGNLPAGEPGFQYIMRAIEKGMHVVTANKAPLSLYWDTIFGHAERNGTMVRIGGAANGGLHTLEMGRLLAEAGELVEFSGLFNSTCPYVLDLMLGGMDFLTGVREAQRLGIAEPDYQTDTDGWDAAQKTVIQANAFWQGAGFTLHDVDRVGIGDVTKRDLRRAQEEGKVWRMVGRANIAKRSISAKPECLSKEHPLAKAKWHDKAILFKTRTQGEQICYGMGAAPTSTAGTMLLDMITIARRI